MVRSVALSLLAAIISTGAFAADIPARENVGSLAALYENPKLGPAIQVNNLPFRISSLSLELTSGSLAPVFAGSHRIGFFFNGTGKYSYLSTDATERTLVQFEAKQFGRTATKGTEGNVTLSGPFERLLVRAEGVDLPEGLASEPSATSELSDAFKKHREEFANVRWTPPSHLLIRSRLDEKNAAVAVVEIGDRDDHGYVLDTIDRKEETLYALISDRNTSSIEELQGAKFPNRLAQQPVGRSRAAFLQPRFLLADLDFTLVAGDKGTANLKVTETVVPRTGSQSVFRFDLLSGLWDDDAHYHRFRVDRVRDQAGNELPFDFDKNSLLVALPAQAPAGEPVTLVFDISGDFLRRPANDSYWLLGISPWFPQPDLNGQFFTVHSIVKVKKPWVAFAIGDLVSKREEGDYNVFENASDKPQQFPVVLAGRYTITEEKFDDVTIRVAAYAGLDDAQSKQLAQLAHKIIKFYEPWLGPFPFKEFNLIEINSLGFGQSPPGIMFMTREAFNPLIDAGARAYSKGVNQRFAHEIAHQYWGVVVKMGSEEEQWLTESFSEFCSALVVKEISGQRGYDALITTWRQEAKDPSPVAPIVLSNRIAIPSNYEKESEYRVGLLYSKGAYVLASLRKDVGDQKFFSLLRNIQGQYAWRFVTTGDVAKLMTRIDGGTDHSPFFDKYVFGTDMPK